MNVEPGEALAGGILSVSTLWVVSPVNVYLAINYREMAAGVQVSPHFSLFTIEGEEYEGKTVSNYFKIMQYS